MNKNLGIVGAGTMGTGIAHVAALNGFEVQLYDINDTILRRASERIKADLKIGVQKGKLTPEQTAAALDHIRTRTSLPDLGNCGFVIEAALEDLRVKKDLFRHLESNLKPTAVLATNTSSFSITSISSGAKHPERFVGMHFFNPAHIMKLVEIVQGDQTSEETVRSATELATALGKTPVRVKDTPGFIVNRIARPFYGEALRLLGEQVASVEDLDRIVKECGGFAMGPFELMDLIGIDVNFNVTQSLYEQYFGEPRYRPHPIQKRMVDSGKLGKKSGKGFYSYEE
jgi:3-hydroxybutyryl-CoA dehydrogenase